MDNEIENISKTEYFVSLLWTFFKIGFFTFGGGLAMIPFIEDEFVSKKKWLTSDEMTDMVSLAQTFPGVVAVNVSILVGHRMAGIIGAVAAAIGTVLPALLSIVLIVKVLSGYEDNQYVKMIFVGIKAASAALILDTVIRMSRKAIKDKIGWIIASIALLIVMLNYSAVWSVIMGAFVGFICYRSKCDRQEGK
ncbi:MAG: chromate transporter [Bacteroidales bacterium]|nr:chromate transporter [Bacteroidales bacterium]